MEEGGKELFSVHWRRVGATYDTSRFAQDEKLASFLLIKKKKRGGAEFRLGYRNLAVGTKWVVSARKN